MRACLHPQLYRLTQRWVDLVDEPIGINVCGLCMEDFGLGPAAADTPAVEIEKRAAEWRADGFTFPDRDQCCCPSCLSRFLANCIATHDQTHGGGE